MSVTAKTLINAQYADVTDTTKYTVPTLRRTIIDKFTATNTDTVTQTITVNLVPVGQTSGPSNIISKAVSIAAGVCYDATELKNQILGPQDFISVTASTASKIVIRCSGREIS